MTTYFTGNPLGSQDPRDLFDNSGNLDQFMLSQQRTFPDRLGVERSTLKALEDATPDAIAARDRAESAADAAQAASTAQPYATLADLQAAPHPGPADEAWAVVTNDPQASNNGFYSWSGIAWLKSALQPATVSDIKSLQGLITPSQATEPIEAVVDEEGGIHRLNTPSMTQDRVHRVEEIDKGGALLSEDGGVLLYQDEERTIVGPMEMGHTDVPGVYVVDTEGGVHAVLAGDALPSDTPAAAGPLSAGAFFSGTLVGAQGVLIGLHVPSLIAERLRGGEIVATLNSTTTPVAVSGGDGLSTTTDALGSAAQLVLRNRSNPAERLVRALSVKTVPVPAVAPTPIRVLYIGDSIGNRQGLLFLQNILSGWGYLPEWIGTLNSSSASNNANDTAGPLGECREGWESGDYTLAVNDRALIVEPGQEAAYLAMSKVDKWPRNPFVRAATGADSAGDVRNGYVMDFAFYQSRFSLQPPDVVVWAMGTNDVRDRTESEVYGAVNGNDALFYRRIKAAWPAAKIIRMVPGTAMDPAREAAWTSKYIPMFRAILDAAAGVAGLTVAPTWAMTNQDAAYSFAAAPDPTTGFTSLPAGWTDAVHPPGALRIGLYQALAPYVAAAGINLI